MSHVDPKRRAEAIHLGGPFLRGELITLEYEDLVTEWRRAEKQTRAKSPSESTDEGLVAFSNSFGIWHDGEGVYRLRDENISATERELAERWLLFLSTDQPYRWPKAKLSFGWAAPWWAALPLFLIALLGAILVALYSFGRRMVLRIRDGKWPPSDSHDFEHRKILFADDAALQQWLAKRIEPSTGDLTVWPFFSMADYEEAKQARHV